MALKSTILVLLFCLPFVNAAAATSDQLQETLPMDGAIQIEGTPAIGDIFSITFRFTLKGQSFNDHLLGTIRPGKIHDQIKSEMEKSIDRAYLLPDTNIEYLSPTKWTGKLETGKEITFTVKLRVLHVLETRIVGVVRTSCMSETGLGMTANYFTSPAIFEGAVPKSQRPTWHTLPNANDSSVMFRPIQNTAPPLDSTKSLRMKAAPFPLPDRKSTSPDSQRKGADKVSQVSLPAGSYLVTGHFYNVYIPHDTVPASYFSGYVAYELYGSWYYDFDFTTDNNGYFQFYLSNTHVEIVLIAANVAAHVVSSSTHNLQEGVQLLDYNLGVEITNPQYQNIDIPAQYTTNTAFPAAFYIADKIHHGCDRFYSLTALMSDTEYVFWDTLNHQFPGSFFGGYSVNGVPIIYIHNKYDSDTSTYNWDQWDEPVILHEYGHYLIWRFGQRSPYAFGKHSLIYPPPDTIINGSSNRIRDLSFNEAVADFLSGVLRESPIFKDSAYAESTYTYNFEQPFPDAPWTWNFETSPRPDSPIWNGACVEGAIVAALWDLYDAADDGNYYKGSTLWGHNNDHNGQSPYNGFSYIWDVLYRYDPWPDSANHDNCWNIYEFIDGWRKRGYPVDQTFTNLFQAHNVHVFIPGDVTQDNRINVGDAVYMLNYVFKGAAIPKPMEAGDANCDNALNVGDAVFLINYVFKGGPTPVICADYEFPAYNPYK